MNTLLIRLEGPLQSWGTRARWTDRDTALEPTKSAVIGLLACALGWGRDADGEIRALTEELRFGVRVERAGQVIRDYQTVSGGALTAERKVKRTASTGELETVVSPRLYLADASFLAAVLGSDETIAQLSVALQAPVWPVYLGRKSCPPSLPLWEGVAAFDSLEAALGTWPRGRRAAAGALRAAIETGPTEGVRRVDQVVALSRRRYGPRWSRDVMVDPPPAAEEVAR